MEKILIKGGRIIDPAQSVDMVADLLLSEGKVAGIEKSIPSTNGARVIGRRRDGRLARIH